MTNDEECLDSDVIRERRIRWEEQRWRHPTGGMSRENALRGSEDHSAATKADAIDPLRAREVSPLDDDANLDSDALRERRIRESEEAWRKPLGGTRRD
jgi:hypothetical protein